MLENTFYNIKKTGSSENAFHVSVALNASHEIYKAHFPESPITPGVCLLQIALELLNAKFERKLQLVHAKKIKYLKVINPLEVPEIDFVFNYVTENDLIFADINIIAGETVFTKVQATYKGL